MLQKGEWDQAITLYQSALDVDAKHVGVLMNLGCALGMKGQSEEAIEQFNKALDLEAPPFQAFILFNVGGIHLREGFVAHKAKVYPKAQQHFREALSFFQKASNAFPGTGKALGLSLASEFSDSVRPWASMDLANGPIEIVFLVPEYSLPPDSGAFSDQFMGSGDLTSFAFNAESPPPLYFYLSPTQYLVFSMDYFGKGDLDNAKKMAQQASDLLEQNPGNLLRKMAKWNALYLTAGVDVVREDWDRALPLLRQARELGVQLPKTEKMLLEAYLSTQEYAAAKELAKRILSSEPEDALALLASRLQLESPALDADGIYRSPTGRFQLRKPKDWILCDPQTNADLFKQKGEDPSFMPCHFMEYPLPLAATVSVQEELIFSPRSKQKGLETLKAGLADFASQTKAHLEGPKEVEMNGKSFFWYRLDFPSSGEGMKPGSSVSWTSFSDQATYTIVGGAASDRIDRYLPIFEEVAGSFQVAGIGPAAPGMGDEPLEALLKDRDYSAAKKMAEEILKKNPEHKLALDVRQTQFDSPNVKSDGTYVSPFGFQVKKPEGWIIVDRETNGELMNDTAWASAGGLCLFFDSFVPPVYQIRIEMEKPPKPLSKEEFTGFFYAAVNQMAAQSKKDSQFKMEGPKEVQLGDKSFYRYDLSYSDPAGGVKSSATWVFFAGDAVYKITAEDSPDRMERLLPVLEGVARSFEVIR